MRDEGYVAIDSRRFGWLAALRRKQWWSFEGLDPERRLYYVFLALQAFPSDYVSLTVIDLQNARRWAEDHLGSFRTAPGDAVEVRAAGKWGKLGFSGSAETGWSLEAATAGIRATVTHRAESHVHRNRLLTRHIDYSLQQFVQGKTEGRLAFDGREHAFSGYGYHEHAWGVQPRHSTAHWLHFWGPDAAGVVMSCHYDRGVPHHTTVLWHAGEVHALASPALFTFDPGRPNSAWKVRSLDLELEIRPIHLHRSRIRIPPVVPYVDIDYTEQLFEMSGAAWVHGERVALAGLGKFDHNWNKW